MYLIEPTSFIPSKPSLFGLISREVKTELSSNSIRRYAKKGNKYRDKFNTFGKRANHNDDGNINSSILIKQNQEYKYKSIRYNYYQFRNQWLSDTRNINCWCLIATTTSIYSKRKQDVRWHKECSSRIKSCIDISEKEWNKDEV